MSTEEQDPKLQLDALRDAGCYRVYVETVSGAITDRPELDKVLESLRPGDTLVVWRLDRLGRSLRHLIDIISDLEDRGIAFRSLQESIDTSTPGGRLVFHVFGALAEFERALIRERTLAGLEAARKRGKVGGRRTVMTPAKLKQARAMQQAGESPSEIAKALGVGRATVYRHLQPPAGPVLAPTPEQPTLATPPSTTTASEVEEVRRPPRPAKRKDWFVVDADRDADEEAPVVVLSSHTTERAASAALVKAHARRAGGVPVDSVLQVRQREQVHRRLEWDPDLRRGAVRDGAGP